MHGGVTAVHGDVLLGQGQAVLVGQSLEGTILLQLCHEFVELGSQIRVLRKLTP